MSDDATYLDECLRLRGGVSADPDDDRAIRNALNELAAARAEVEAVRNERDRSMQRCEWIATALHGDPMFGAGNEEPLVKRVRALQADLAAVRKVEEWIQRGNDPLKPEHAIAGVVNRRYGAFVRCEAEETTVATGKSLIALGRALAAQEGTDAT